MNKRLVVGFLALGVGCGGTPTPSDGGLADTGGPSTLLSVASPNTIDYTCLGTATVPTGGASTSAIIEATEYVAHTPTRMTTVELYTNDLIMPPCATPNCVSGATDVMGHVTLSAPAGGWVGIHVIPATPDCSGGTDMTACGALPNCEWGGTSCDVAPDTAEVLAYNQTWPTTAGATLGTYAFSASSINLVSQLLGRQFQRATAGAISGQISDCMGHTVGNAEARVYQGTTQIVTGMGNTSARISGLSGTSPTRNGLTGSGGTFVGANVPAGDDYHVEMWGTRTDGGAAELVGCEEGRVVAGAITVLVIGALRSDYPAGSACATAAAAAGH